MADNKTTGNAGKQKNKGNTGNPGKLKNKSNNGNPEKQQGNRTMGNSRENRRGRQADPRVLVCRIIGAVLEEGAFSHEEIARSFRQYPDMDPRDRGMIEYCTRAVLEHLYQIDAYLALCASKPVRKLKPWIRTILRVSMAQLLYMDRIPPRAVLNEAGKLTGQFGLSGLRGYVNGVLRGYLRLRSQAEEEGFDLEEKAMQAFAQMQGFMQMQDCRPDDEVQADYGEIGLLSFHYSMPAWIISRYVKDFGIDQAEGILAAYQKPVRIACARNKAVINRAAFTEAMDRENAQAEPLPYGLDGLYLNGTDDLTAMKPFQDGAFFIQDVSSMVQGLVVHGGQLIPGDQAIHEDKAAEEDHGPNKNKDKKQEQEQEQEHILILDVCGAPGGKSIHAASDLEGKGRVICRDLSREKADRILENVRRLRLDNVEVQVWDALKEDPSLTGKADLVIADLPCSGLGIIGRKPEIRYRVQEADITELAALQRQILKVCASYVKPGGRLVYSTCTLSREEDEDNYRYLTEELPFSPESLDPYLPAELRSAETGRGRLKLIPGIHECDGFFVSSAIRRKE